MMQRFGIIQLLLIFYFCLNIAYSQDANQDSIIKENLEWTFSDENISVEMPEFFHKNKPGTIGIELKNELREIRNLNVEINGKAHNLTFLNGKSTFQLSPDKDQKQLILKFGDFTVEKEIVKLNFPLWLSIMPPLIAIALALVFREVILSLFIGIFFGAGVLGYYNQDSIWGIFSGFLAVIDTYIVNAMTDSSHMAILLFSLLIGGMVALISRNGGMMGVVNRISTFAKTPKTGQFATWLLGLVIFFDDYANTLVVGNTMRSITDKLKISREKLSYLVDSTAAPVAALAFITTWIGAELGYIQDGIVNLSDFPANQSPYTIFINSLAYSFYPVLTLLFMLMVIFTGRDFGPMLKAERRARSTGVVSQDNAGSAAELEDDLRHFQPIEGIKHRSFNAAIPVGVLVFGVLTGLVYTGYNAEIWNDASLGFIQKLSQTIGASDSYAALMWASLCSVGVALILTIGQKMMNAVRAIETMSNGFKAMLGAVMILIMAWSLQGVTEDMHTADFLTDLLGESLSPPLIPAITFILAAVVAFSTGSSWSTMAILYPLLIPLTWQVSMNTGLVEAESLPILYNVVASLLAGSVLGDHCSPISDTTILSSLASSCNHIDHVRTQLPYALVVGVVATFIGILPSAYGVPSVISFLVAIGVLFAIVRFLGKEVEAS
ncbi:MAG: Na+/H+ antiporter NhaC family protein [Bacteroidia bacterium]